MEYAEKQLKKINDAFWMRINNLEKEKFLYFLLTYKQKVVLIKTGEKNEEKRFLGYEFSYRRGNEGIHPIQRSKTIDECTRLFDEKIFDNPEKASTYIYKAFNYDYDFPIHESLKNNISRVNLVDMLNFDRSNFEKEISTVVKKNVNIESKWEIKKLGDVAKVIKGVTYSKSDQTDKETSKIILTADNISLDGDFEVKKKIFLQESFIISKEKKLVANDIFICFSSGSKEHLGKVAFINTDTEFYAGGFMGIIRTNNNIVSKYIFQLLNTTLRQMVRDTGSGSNINNLSSVINEIQIPSPPLEIQKKIVAEIETLEKQETKAKREIDNWKKKIEQLFTEAHNKADVNFRLSDNIFDISIGKRVIEADLNINGTIPVYSANVFEPFGYIDKYLINDFSIPSVLWGIDGDWMVNYIPANKPFYPTDHCGVLRIKTNDILPKYLAWILNKKGIAENFSRTLRASIDRIKNISINIPPLSEQQKIVAEIENIEVKMHDMQKELEQLSTQKGFVLKKYL